MSEKVILGREPEQTGGVSVSGFLGGVSQPLDPLLVRSNRQQPQRPYVEPFHRAAIFPPGQIAGILLGHVARPLGPAVNLYEEPLDTAGALNNSQGVGNERLPSQKARVIEHVSRVPQTVRGGFPREEPGWSACSHKSLRQEQAESAHRQMVIHEHGRTIAG